jgi:hypothetical protein
LKILQGLPDFVDFWCALLQTLLLTAFFTADFVSDFPFGKSMFSGRKIENPIDKTPDT